jgi:Mrp family chromosome partitioning ATPase
MQLFSQVRAPIMGAAINMAQRDQLGYGGYYVYYKYYSHSYKKYSEISEKIK